jgi:hypothetical protein
MVEQDVDALMAGCCGMLPEWIYAQGDGITFVSSHCMQCTTRLICMSGELTATGKENCHTSLCPASANRSASISL